jgi:hypothetical protein
MFKKNSIKALTLFFSFSILISSCSLFKNSETAELRKEIEELKKKGSEDTEKTNDPNTPTGEKTKKTVKMSSGYLTMRDAPDAKTGKLIARIPNGAEVMVGGCQDEKIKIGGREGHWCKVTYKDQEGWAFDAFLVEGGTAKESSNKKTNYLITTKSAGDVRFGMTIAGARKILKGAKFTRDMGEEVPIISVDQGGKSLLWLYTDGRGDDTSPIVETEKIEGIDIFDSRFKTADGVHCRMTVSDAEKKFGKLKKIWKEGPTGNELATFSRHPKGFNLWIAPRVLRQDSKTFQYNTAGIYGKEDPDNTTRYETGAIISMISIPGYDSP